MADAGLFICEALVSGGPRHRDEVELCEDVAGIITFPEGAVFYIADATSDEGRMGPFSSHYFANSLGFWFLKAGLSEMANGIAAINLDQVFESALDDLKNAWQSELSAFMKKPKAEQEIHKVAEPFKSEEGGGWLKVFSTTFCGGVISSADRNVRLVRTGDIDLIVKHGGEDVQRKPMRKERIFVQFIKKENEEPKFRFPELTYEHYAAEELEYLIVKTDGVSFLNDELTINALKGCGIEDVLKFRRILLKGITSKGDDKALLYCAFMNR
ncbi:MAG: protein phosphatase 2C domain-containing protein [Nitrospinota bacterium]